MDGNPAQYFYTEATADPHGYKAHVQKNANIILWDGNTGEPFFMPPGGDPMRYLAKGFKANPPVGWEQDPNRPLLRPSNGMSKDEWTPAKKKSALQLEYDNKLAEMQKEAAKKTALQDTAIGNAGNLAAALSTIAEKLGGEPEPAKQKREAVKA